MIQKYGEKKCWISQHWIDTEKKNEIKEEKRIDNSLASKLWFRGRSNTMNLNIDNKYMKKGSTVCDLCEEEDEDMSHFLLRCKKLEKERDYSFMKKKEDEDDEVILEKIFFGITDEESIKEMLTKMHRKREKIREEKIRKIGDESKQWQRIFEGPLGKRR